MRVLFIGGTGEISLACLQRSAEAGLQCAVFNRGRSADVLPTGVRQIAGDLNDEPSYAALARERFDVVCQFKAYTHADLDRDLRVFSGQVGQYVFISTASAYQKPPRQYRLTEDVPLNNPYWDYSQAKADMEQRLWEAHAEGRMPVTVVRPSHTLRTKFPGTFMSGDEHAWRILNGKPVIVHGDGTSLWTITSASDFAVPFAKLLGNSRALGEAFHITSDQAYSWDQIFAWMGETLARESRIVHVPSETLARCNRQWMGPLLGDKSWSTVFDNAKVKQVAGEFTCRVSLDKALRESARHVRTRLERHEPNAALHAQVDRIIEQQELIRG